jgi:hypothetical protein
MRQDEYGARSHRQLTSRAALLRDRGLNLFSAVESLEKSIPDDPRFEKLKDWVSIYFERMDDLFTIEDGIDDTITLLAAEVGR